MKIILNILLFCLPISIAGNLSAAPLSFECKYDSYSDKSGKHKFVEDLAFKILWDAARNSSYIMGNNGSEKLDVVDSVGSVTFIEKTLSGNIMTTSINKKTMESVHSRNTLGIPSQSYGKCIQK